VEKFKTSLIVEILKSHTTLIESFWKPQTKKHYYWIKRRKALIEDEEITDRWQQYVEELYNDSDELKREEEITPEELGPTITKSEFEKALNELKSKKAYEVDNTPA